MKVHKTQPNFYSLTQTAQLAGASHCNRNDIARFDSYDILARLHSTILPLLALKYVSNIKGIGQQIHRQRTKHMKYRVILAAGSKE